MYANDANDANDANNANNAKKQKTRTRVLVELELSSLSDIGEKRSLIETLSEKGRVIYALLEGINDPLQLLGHLNNLANSKTISWKMWMILYNVAIVSS